MGHFDRWEKKMFSDSEITTLMLGSIVMAIVFHIIGLFSYEQLEGQLIILGSLTIALRLEILIRK